jgi:dihydroorotase
MSPKLRIAGGIVHTPAGARSTDVLVEGERIAGLVSHDVAAGPDEEVIDASGKVVLPGMVDVHVHAREPGFTHKEDIVTTTQQAAVGGVTTIFGMPNLNPPTTTVQTLRDVFDLYAARSLVDWNHNPAPTVPEEIEGMAELGIRAYKIYMVRDTGRDYPHPAGTAMHDHGRIFDTMLRIKETGARLIIHPHDQALMDAIEGPVLARGDNTPADYAGAYAAHEGVIWDTAVATILRLCEATGCPMHIAHMQTRRSIDAVRRAKARGVPVTCEVNHWGPFLSTWEHVKQLGPYALSYWVPDDAREAMWAGMRDGTIDIASSDHAPHTREEKEIGWTQMWSSHTGTPGIQYYYPLLLDAAVRGVIDIDRVVDMAAAQPARHFGLAGVKGSIEVGADADLVIADLNAPWTITNDDTLSRCGWTPYDGVECRVRIERTLVRGREVARDGRFTGRPGFGELACPRGNGQKGSTWR